MLSNSLARNWVIVLRLLFFYCDGYVLTSDTANRLATHETLWAGTKVFDVDYISGAPAPPSNSGRVRFHNYSYARILHSTSDALVRRPMINNLMYKSQEQYAGSKRALHSRFVGEFEISAPGLRRSAF